VRRLAISILFLLFATLCLAKETVKFEDVKIHRHKSSTDRMLVDKVGVLKFDDSARKLTFSDSSGDRFEAGYDDISKIVFEVTVHMHGGTAGRIISDLGAPGAVVGLLAYGMHVQDHWFYLEYKSGDQKEQVLLEVPQDSSPQVIAKAQGLFGSRVAIPEFKEKGEPIQEDEDLDAKHILDLRSRHTVIVDKQSHPLPKTKSDKATVVVVCPRYAGHQVQFKLHANDHVIAVNRSGTYSFAYLDPGHYKLISQSENANGFEMNLDAGESYYFLQNTFEGALKAHTTLSRNSPEIVMYEVNGSYYSDWKRKSKPNESVPDSAAAATK
jgi:hypothetical protein